ncbi:MAG: MFS transporter [Candidatus Rokubacteria bacterium]|nr:MFS transporter [Candidatus Rokubacteria bacterium]
MTGTADGSGNRWVALAVLTFARTAMGFQFQSVGAVSPLLMERLHIANTELGWLIGLFSLPGVFLALPGGLLGGRFGDRRVVLAGLGLMTLGSALMGAAEGFAAVAVGRLLSAVGAILLNVLLTKMVTDWFAGREIIWAMTVLINSWPVGIGLASLIPPRSSPMRGACPPSSTWPLGRPPSALWASRSSTNRRPGLRCTRSQ